MHTPIFFPRRLVVAAVALTCAFSAVAVVTPARTMAADAGAQALIDQALSLWQQSKRIPGPELTPADLEAKALLERVVAEYPGTEEAADALRHLAYGHYYKGRKDEGMAYYNRLFTEYPTSHARFRAYEDRAWFFAQEGKMQEALEDSKRALEAAVTDEEKAEAMADVGHALFCLQKHAEALQWFERVLKEHPESPELSLVRPRAAACKQYLKDYAGAVALYEEAAAKEPNLGQRGTLLLAAADAWREGGYYDKALIALEKIEADDALVQAMRDGKAALLLVRGRTLLAQGKREQGLDILRTAAACAPASESAGKASLEIADWYAAEGDQQKALEEYLALGQNQAANAWYRAMAYIRAGRIHRTLKQFESAVAAYDQAVQLAPGSGAASLAHAEKALAEEEMRAHKTSRELSEAELDSTKGSWFGGNNAKCYPADLASCTSLCLPCDEPWYGGYNTYRMAFHVSWSHCTGGWPWDYCVDNLYVKCGQYKECPGSDCIGGCVPTGPPVCTWGCDGTNC